MDIQKSQGRILIINMIIDRIAEALSSVISTTPWQAQSRSPNLAVDLFDVDRPCPARPGADPAFPSISNVRGLP